MDKTTSRGRKGTISSSLPLEHPVDLSLCINAQKLAMWSALDQSLQREIFSGIGSDL